MEAKIAAAERMDAMKLFYRVEAGIPEPEQLPLWPEQIQFNLAETVLRELRAVAAYEPATISPDCSKLLLTGEHSPDHLSDAVDTVESTIQRSQRVEFDGVGHVGTKTAPEAIANAVKRFGRAIHR